MSACLWGACDMNAFSVLQMMEESLQASREIPNADLRKQVGEALFEHVKAYINGVSKVWCIALLCKLFDW